MYKPVSGSSVLFPSFNLVTELVGSRNCVFDAEDTVRVPYSRYVDTARW